MGKGENHMAFEAFHKEVETLEEGKERAESLEELGIMIVMQMQMAVFIAVIGTTATSVLS